MDGGEKMTLYIIRMVCPSCNEEILDVNTSRHNNIYECPHCKYQVTEADRKKWYHQLFAEIKTRREAQK